MTRKDYEKLAAAMKHCKPESHVDPIADYQWQADVQAIAGVLAADNPRFDRKRFLAAAGVER